MNKIFLLLLVALGLACSEPQKQRVQPQKGIVRRHVVKLSKLERLKRMPKGKVITHCDLSNDNILTFPNLSRYTIKSLDLSHNQLKTVNVNYLPKGLVKLNLSYNQFRELFDLSIPHESKLSFEEMKRRYKANPLREIDLSHNQIKSISIGFPLRKIIVSHNDLRMVNYNHSNIKFLDISYNPHLSNVVDFVPERVETIIRDGIANDKPLVEKDELRYIE